MDIHVWTAYLFASLLIAVSPGSGAVLAMSHGVRFGVKRTGATILGLECGLVVILLIAGAGIGSLLVASEIAFNVVKILGALYLIYLGFSQWRAPVSPVSPVLSAQSDNTVNLTKKREPAAVLSTWRRRCASGFLTNVTNPKGIVFMVAVLPQFISQDRPLALQLLVMSLTTVIVDVAVMHGYALAGRSMQKLFRNAQALKIQNRLFGGLLMAIGAALFFVKRGNHSL